MKDRNMRTRMCVVLFASLFSSVAFAQLSIEPSRASLAGTDFIDWQSADNGVGDYTWLSVPNVTSEGGAALIVTQQESPNSFIISEPSQWYRDTNLPIGPPTGNYRLDTEVRTNAINPISFSYANGDGFCGLGTQVAPYELGSFIAKIEAFDANGSMGDFPVPGSSDDNEAAFVGISSTDPMNRVEISLIHTDGGVYAAWYAINQVDFKACETVPEIPKLRCEGFAAPMDNYLVKANGNRAYPLKMELFDEFGFEQTDIELVAAPVVSVIYTASSSGEPIDVTSDVLTISKKSEGNQFVFTTDGNWHFNLGSKNYTASGTYLVSVVSGDDSEYAIDESCVTSFVKK